MIETTKRDEVKEFRPSQVELWLLNPEQISALAPLEEKIFSEEERKKSLQFRDERTRRHWIGRQAALRLVLGSYLGLDPDAVRLGKSDQGKPQLEGEGPRFSVSSCEGWWLAAFSDQEVGVDLETIRPNADLRSVAQNWFNENELACLEATLHEEERLRLFYRTWTRKEARLKLQGIGLAGLAALRERNHDPVWLEDLELEDGLVASLALQRSPAWVRRRDWVAPDKHGTLSALRSSPDPFPAAPATGLKANARPQGTASGFYPTFDMGGKDGAETLRLQTAILLFMELPAILETFPKGGSLIDLGCGSGQFSDAVARACPDALVSGFDADPLAIEEAHRQFGSRPGLSFQCRSIEQGPPSGFAAADSVVLRLVLMHHPEPIRALEAARAWLKPGGILHVIDADDRGIVTKPALPWLPELLDLMQMVQEHKGGSRRLGRELSALLASAGWDGINQRELNLDSLAIIAALPKAFLPVADYYLSEASRLALAPAKTLEHLNQGLLQIKETVFTHVAIPFSHAWAHRPPEWDSPSF